MVALDGFKGRLALLVSLLLWISASVVLANPIGLPTTDAENDLEKRIKPKFPSLDDIKGKFTAPPKDTAFFFTGLNRQGVKEAKEYAEKHGLHHVGQSYPDRFTNPGEYDGSAKERREFQENFSRVFAEGTTGVAYLLIDNNKEPKDDSIFKTVEFPALRDGGKVPKIVRFNDKVGDPKGSDKQFWP